MLATATADTKKATARGNSRPQAASQGLLAPPVPVLGNQASLRLQRKCGCGGGPDCGCDKGDPNKKEQNSPRTGLHRKASGPLPASASTLLDAETQSFFEARLQRYSPAAASAQPGPSLPIGAVDDPLERQADQIADRVMRMPENAAPKARFHAGREGQALSREALYRKASGALAGPRTAAPQATEPQATPLVHEVLRSPGEALDRPTRDFFEPRFGYDLSQVRVHTDAQAAQSAQSVQAQAYAVGRHIAFGPGMYAPSSTAGRTLLAHELAHTVQQDGSSSVALQRACRSGALCANPIRGDSGRFGEKSEKEAEAERKKSGPPPVGGAAAPCKNPRHKDPATNYTKLTKDAGAPVPPEVSGIFIDACMGASAEAQESSCADFTDGPPPGSDPAKGCIAVQPGDEDKAAAILAKPTRSDSDNRVVLDFASTVLHEAQHTHFDTNPSGIVTAAADCDLNTVIFHSSFPAPTGTDFTVEFYLSEISAEIAEFAPFFQNFKATGKGGEMFKEQRNVTLNEGESILGDIKALQCKCECATVDKFVADVFADATKSWPPDQTLEFQQGMTRTMPSFWPKALQKT